MRAHDHAYVCISPDVTYVPTEELYRCVWLCVLWVGPKCLGPCGCVDGFVTEWRRSGGLGLGPHVSPSPCSAPDVAQWFTALLCPGDTKMQNLRTTSPLHIRPQNRLLP